MKEGGRQVGRVLSICPLVLARHPRHKQGLRMQPIEGHNVQGAWQLECIQYGRVPRTPEFNRADTSC